MRPGPMNEDELHDALVVHGFLTDDEARAWPTMLANLKQARRVVRLCIPCRSGEGLWVAAERLREMRVVLADAHVDGEARELGAPIDAADRKSVVQGTRGAVRVVLGGRRTRI